MTVERSRIRLLLGGLAIAVAWPPRASAAGREGREARPPAITVYKNPT